MSSFKPLPFILLAGAIATAMMAFFTVGERELAIKRRFGEILDSEYDPGLHFKVPFIDKVLKFDDRILTLDNPSERFLTVEKKNLEVDFFVKWEITDTARFYLATSGNEGIASQRLLEIIKDSIRAEFARRTVVEVVSSERTVLLDDMIRGARESALELGINVVDVRVKRIDLPKQVSGSVYDRMREERQRIASQLRAEGAEAAEQIRAEAERERTVLLAEAYRDAEKLRGEGDATATDIYAQAYSKNREFYAFHRSLQAYRESLGAGDLLVLQPDSEFFKYLNSQAGK